MAEVKYLTKDERAAEKKKLKEEKARFKKEQLAQKKEVKKRAQELADKEDELEGEDGTGGLPVFLVTVLIIVIWLAILCVLVKLDVGGIGSNVLKPLLKDVPVVNQILPEDNTNTTVTEYGGYTNLIDAVNQIRSLEQQLEEVQKQKLAEDTTVEELKAEITRLKTFEEQQTEFERIRTEFYNEVVYSDEGLGEEAYQKYYESMDPTTAEYLYKQVIRDVAASKDIEDYVAAYSAMKAKDAAEIFDTMTDNLELVAKILANMDSDSRGKILAEMDSDVAARVTKILDPD